MPCGGQEGDTALLRAVRNRQAEMVELLLDRKARISAVDVKGDTCLHIAMRARSRVRARSLARPGCVVGVAGGQIHALEFVVVNEHLVGMRIR